MKRIGMISKRGWRISPMQFPASLSYKTSLANKGYGGNGRHFSGADRAEMSTDSSFGASLIEHQTCNLHIETKRHVHTHTNIYEKEDRNTETRGGYSKASACRRHSTHSA